MKKLEIKIPVILPGVPDEKDMCVLRLTELLQKHEGLEKVHISDRKEEGAPQLCFHYDPDTISVERIQTLAKQPGLQFLRNIIICLLKSRR